MDRLKKDSVFAYSDIEVLEQENSLLRTLFEYTHRPAMFVTDPDQDFRFVLANNATCEHFGINRQQLYQLTPADIDPDYSQKKLCQLIEYLEKHKSKAFESQHLLKDGRIIPVEVITNYFEYKGKKLIVGYFQNIEARKQAEKRKQEEEIQKHRRVLEQQYKIVLDNLYDRVYLLQVTKEQRLQIIDVNRPAAEQFEQVKAGHVGSYLEDNLPSEKVPWLKHNQNKCLTTGEACHYEDTLYNTQGKLMHLDITMVPLKNEEGLFERIILVTRDVSEKKRQEEQREQREREFRALVENSKDAIVRYDRQCRRLYANPAFICALGSSSAEEVLGKSIQDEQTYVAERAYFSQQIQEVFSTGKSHNTDLVFSRNGEEYCYEVHMIPEFDNDNNVLSVLCVGRDYSPRRQAELALQKREEDFRSLVENSPDTISRHEPDGRRIYINPKSIKMSGPMAEVILNTTPEEYPGGENGQLYQRKIQEAVNSKMETEFELVWFSKNGPRCSLINLVPEQNASGEIVSILAIGRDITLLKNIRQDLEQSRAQLRELIAYRERAKENERKHIARELHDELGQQLTALKIETQILEVRYGDLATDFKNQITRIKEQLKNTISFTRNFVSRLRPSALDMGIIAALEWLVEDIVKLNPNCQFHLVADHDDIFLCEEKAIALFRIVQESLTNITKHAKATQVNIVLRNYHSHLEVEIKDNGCGFDTEHYYQKSFGLVGIKERASMIHAEFMLSSEIGKGTCIKVHIPLHSEEH